MLYQLSYSRPRCPARYARIDFGGEGRIRTSEAIRRQIYSLFPLTTREPRHEASFSDRVPSSELAKGVEPPTG